MNKIIAAVIFILGVIGLFVLKDVTDDRSTAHTLATSDAKSIRASVKIGVDSWVGYYPLCSRNFKSALRNDGIRSSCEQQTNLEKRFEQLKNGDLQFAVSSVDAYLALGQKTQFSATIIAVIDESKGGDALVAWEDTVSSIDELKTNPNLRVALTPDSPSEHLVRSLAVHFDVQNFQSRGKWLVASDSAEQAEAMLENHQVDAAVLWEPNVTKALQVKGIKKILGTEDTEHLIVDVLLVNRDYAQAHPDIVQQVLQRYFEALDGYRNAPDSLVSELKKNTGLDTTEVQAMLKGVQWATLADNAYDWFSTTSQQISNSEYLIDVIDSSYDILHATKVLDKNPLPDENPYLITNSHFVDQLFTQLVDPKQNRTQTATDVKFATLNDAQWRSLRDVGTLKVRQIPFASSSDQLSMEAKRTLDQAAQDLSHYPNFRILVKGHTGINGDKQANRKLSQERAEAVVRYLSITHSIQDARMQALGVGSDEPLSRLPNESYRAYKYRLPRVELILKARNP
ncbi:Outer membrane protein OmpA [Vibrio xiamenensis]|uniref:Outer membrane protein OmpA n=1 Tax=Vibrio xiamenensis TaxID=861298 RepID=A0A1G8DDK5_9VIBR|nr:OmpA family protein [Vibrio xiamenensis]SDH55703.1 Outer membrane protein OmpA [Vibrio xiamenensis]